MFPLSACIIAKNEEVHIENCLKSLAGIAGEIIVVDTGSSDRTISLAEKYTDKVFSFVWCNDFSKAKNYAVSLASYDWILNIDCDESIDFIDKAALSDFLQPANEMILGQVSLQNIVTRTGDSSIQKERISRLFSRKYYHFTGAVHEQLTPVSSFQKEHAALPLTLLHAGYADEEILRQKALRNIALLEKELAHSPSAYLYYQMGQSYYTMSDFQNAAANYEKALKELWDFSPAYVQTLIIHYGYCLLELRAFAAALKLEGFSPLFENLADFAFLLGLIYMNNAMFDHAIAFFEKAASSPHHHSEGVNGYLAYYNVGLIYECTGNTKKATEYYKKCGSYTAAKNRLFDLSQQR